MEFKNAFCGGSVINRFINYWQRKWFLWHPFCGFFYCIIAFKHVKIFGFGLVEEKWITICYYSSEPNRGAGTFINFDENFPDFPIARLLLITLFYYCLYVYLVLHFYLVY